MRPNKKEMNRIFLILFSNFLFFSAKSQNSILDSLINIKDAERIVSFLSSDSLKGRFTGTDEAKKATDYIVSEFKSAGLKPISGYEDCLMPFLFKDKSTGNKVAYNVLAGLTGQSNPNEIIIFSAHYDHLGTFSTNPYPSIHPEELKKKNTDTIYNGANDNASGITALILLAKYFAALNNNNRTLIFVAFAGEELGLLGSIALAEKVVPKQTVAVINIEMIGRDSQGEGHPFITGKDFSNMGNLLNKELEKKDKVLFGKNFFRNDPYAEQKLFSRSDNYSFAKLGIPAHTIMLTTGTDKYYHSVNDEIGTIDFNVMIHTIRAIALSTEGLIIGSIAANRILRNW